VKLASGPTLRAFRDSKSRTLFVSIQTDNIELIAALRPSEWRRFVASGETEHRKLKKGPRRG
jgi:hypothetical protein